VVIRGGRFLPRQKRRLFRVELDQFKRCLVAESQCMKKQRVFQRQSGGGRKIFPRKSGENTGGGGESIAGGDRVGAGGKPRQITGERDSIATTIACEKKKGHNSV